MVIAQTHVQAVATLQYLRLYYMDIGPLSRYYVDMCPLSRYCVDICLHSNYCADRFLLVPSSLLDKYPDTYGLIYQLLSRQNNLSHIFNFS